MGRGERRENGNLHGDCSAGTFQTAYDSQIRKHLDTIDGIRAYLRSDVTRLLPEVVVVGDQSSGKASRRYSALKLCCRVDDGGEGSPLNRLSQDP